MTSPLIDPYPRLNVSLTRGEGVYVFDENGKRYLDFSSGVAVLALGHCHPRLTATLAAQASRLWYCSNLFHTDGQHRVASRLAEASFAEAVFFCNSGVEAVECGLKMIRKYFKDNAQPQRYRMIVTLGGFHGRTLAACSAGGQEKLIKGFGPALEGFDKVPFDDLDAVRRAIGSETAGIFVEPVQGDGGIRPASPGYLRGLRDLADENGILLFLDEVQTGMGRSGHLFAHEREGIEPDVLAAGKGLGAGFPIGACLAKAAVASAITPGSHGSTLGGSPLAMAVAEAVLDEILSKGFLENVQGTARLLRQGLEDVVADYGTVVEGVRGLGLMMGLKCHVPNRQFQETLAEKGMLSVMAGDNVVRVLPPLIIEETHVEEALGIYRETCKALC